ncbi:MAG: ATP-binding protein [Candidatus Marinimicrobia bacterium]|nr:ATP-binding protein [Candidatus Neomarinimicrobiota bacterium]
MIRFSDLSIKVKLVSIQLFTTLFVLVFFVGIYLFTQYRQFEDTSFSRLSTLGEILGSNSVSALMFFDNEAAEDVLESLITQPDILNAAIYDHEGKLFATFDKPDVPAYPFSGITVEPRIVGEHFFLFTQKITFDNLTVGWITLRLDTSNRTTQLIEALWQSLFIFSIGLALASLMSIRIQKPISDSILSLAGITKKVRESGNYSLRVVRKSQDEIGTLVDNFNAMMEKISHNEKHLEDLVAERTMELETAKTKAEESDHLKSAFLASMSHELRTPLNSIIGFTGILLQKLAGPLTDEQKKQLSMVKGSASHLLDLINDVLDISKIESGRLQVYGEAFKIDLLVIMTASALRPFAEKKGLTLEYTIANDIPELHSDKRRLEQVLINLINNAIKFTDEGSIKIVCSRHGENLSIAVIDTGLGIKEADQVHIFQSFRQVDTGLDRVREGSGLGLAICKRLTALLGGTISVESQPGVGSTFTVILPFNLETCQ